MARCESHHEGAVPATLSASWSAPSTHFGRLDSVITSSLHTTPTRVVSYVLRVHRGSQLPSYVHARSSQDRLQLWWHDYEQHNPRVGQVLAFRTFQRKITLVGTMNFKQGFKMVFGRASEIYKIGSRLPMFSRAQKWTFVRADALQTLSVVILDSIKGGVCSRILRLLEHSDRSRLERFELMSVNVHIPSDPLSTVSGIPLRIHSRTVRFDGTF